MRLTIVVAVAVSLGLASCGVRHLGPGEARLVVDGRVQVAAIAHGFRQVTGSRLLRSGDRVRVLRGSARIEFSDDRSMELRRDSQVLFRGVPRLVTGHALVNAGKSVLGVAMGATDAQVRNGVAHLTQSLTAVAAAYAGSVDLESAGRHLEVPALRQAAIATPGLVPDHPVPLAYDPSDPWDRRYLGDTIELGNDLAARSRGFTAQLAPNEGHTVGFYRQLLPMLDAVPEFSDAILDPERSPGETLVGLGVIVGADRGSFGERYAAVFAFRDEGASWGLVAADQHVTRSPLLRDLDLAIGRAFTPFAPPRDGTQDRTVRPNGLVQGGPPSPATTAPSGTTPTTKRRPRPTTTTSLPGGVTIPTVTVPGR